MTDATVKSSSDPLDLEPELRPLGEERVRDLLGAAEELHYLGSGEPAVVAAGAALGGVLRLRAGHLVRPSASVAEMLGAVSPSGHTTLHRLLRSHDRLVRGYLPEPADVLSATETDTALATIVDMLEEATAPRVPAALVRTAAR